MNEPLEDTKARWGVGEGEPDCTDLSQGRKLGGEHSAQFYRWGH